MRSICCNIDYSICGSTSFLEFNNRRRIAEENALWMHIQYLCLSRIHITKRGKRKKAVHYNTHSYSISIEIFTDSWRYCPWNILLLLRIIAETFIEASELSHKKNFEERPYKKTSQEDHRNKIVCYFKTNNYLSIYVIFFIEFWNNCFYYVGCIAPCSRGTFHKTKWNRIEQIFFLLQRIWNQV